MMSLNDYNCNVGGIRIKGIRVGIETVLYEYLHGSRSPKAIAERYPSLTLEQVHATITYYLHNEQAIREYLTRWLEQASQRRAEQNLSNPAIRRLRELKLARNSAKQPTSSSRVSTARR